MSALLLQTPVLRRSLFSYVPVLPGHDRRWNHSRTEPPWNVLFFGTDFVSLRCLEALHANRSTSRPVVNDLEVLCPPDLVSHAPVAVKSFSLSNSIPVHHPLPSLKEWQVPLSSDGSRFDVAVVASFGHLIPAHIIKSFPFGGINMHPSLLPMYRGAAPVYHTLLNDDKETGVTILELSINKFDAGKILLQQKHSVPADVQYLQLVDTLARKGADMLLTVLTRLPHFKQQGTPQDETKVTKAPKITKDMGDVRWHDHTARDVYRLYRTFGDTVGIHTRFSLNNEIVRLVKVLPPNTRLSYKEAEKYDDYYAAGMTKYDVNQDLLFVKCKEGWSAVQELQVAGKRVQRAGDFVNGYQFRSVKKPDSHYTFVNV